MIVFGEDNDDANTHIKKIARNLPGVDACHVNRLNILQLAPGGHLGRFLVFTKSAFKKLNGVFGTNKAECLEKKGYNLNRTVMNCADIARIINSDQVQAKLRAQRTSVRIHDKTKKNPLTNKAIMNRLNPYAKKQTEILRKLEADRKAARAKVIKEKRSKAGRAKKHARTKLDQGRQAGLVQSFADADAVIAEEIRMGAYQPGDTEEEDE